jgi:ankyrin repeat protein
MRAKVCEGFDVGTNGFDWLLERQGDRDSPDSYGTTALHAAAETGNAKLIELLVRGGADKEKKFRNRTALHIAADSGSVEAVQQLIILGADISARTLGGKNPLHLAVLEDRSGVVRELLKTEGADAGDDFGKGALHLATALGSCGRELGDGKIATEGIHGYRQEGCA